MNYLRAFVVSFALLAIFSLYSCADKSKEHALGMFFNAIVLSNENNYDSAIALCNITLENDSNLLEAEYLKAQCLMFSEKYDDAILSYKRCVGKSFLPDSANMWIANCYFDLGWNEQRVSGKDSLANIFYQLSVNHSDSALRLNDKLYYAHIYKVHSYHNMHKFKEALDAVNKSILLFPDSLQLFVQRAIEKGSLNDHKTAIDEFSELERKISDIDSFYASQLYRYRGLSHSELKEHRKAVEDFTRALEYDSENEMIYLNRATSYYFLGKKDLCCEDLRKSADLGYIVAYDMIEKLCNK